MEHPNYTRLRVIERSMIEIKKLVVDVQNKYLSSEINSTEYTKKMDFYCFQLYKLVLEKKTVVANFGFKGALFDVKV